MKHLARFLSLTILLWTCAALVLAQDKKPQGGFVTDRPWPEYTPESWKEFSPKDGRFKVLLPDTPAATVQTLESPFGRLDMHTFVMQTFAYYVIGYVDFPEKDGIRDAKTFLRGSQAGHLAATKSELLEEKIENRFGFPGRSFKARVPGGYVKHVRLHLIKNRYYIIFIAVPEKAPSAETRKFYEETVAKFLDSFKPTDLEGGVKVAPPGLPAGINIEIDPALSKQRPFSRKGEPEPAAGVSGGIRNFVAAK
jgi:hypothetical protein